MERRESRAGPLPLSPHHIIKIPFPTLPRLCFLPSFSSSPSFPSPRHFIQQKKSRSSRYYIFSFFFSSSFLFWFLLSNQWRFLRPYRYLCPCRRRCMWVTSTRTWRMGSCSRSSPPSAPSPPSASAAIPSPGARLDTDT